jgi:bifunctional non-homologous end joining protein LigD
MPSGLGAYRAKRRFSETSEPKGGAAPSDELVFVVQKHHARHMHYDLRLQIGDTLKSWAVPEGPCLDPKVRRFAKLVEDHPLEYATFEGRIPDGNYGAGMMIVWDRGTWVTLTDPEALLAKGEIKFRLAGEKLGGGWMLKRLPDDTTNWLLIKERDPDARPLAEYDVLAELPNSVLTGKPVDEAPAAPRKRPPRKIAAKIAGAVSAPMPTRWKPQLAAQADAAPLGDGWLHEIKHDGYRTLVFFENGKARLITRNGLDWTRRYGGLAKAFETLACKNAILDGEVVVQDSRGISSLNLLEAALDEGDGSVFTFYAFDLPYLDGFDLSAARLIDRKAALAGLVDPLIDDRSPVQLSDHVEGDGAVLFAEASRMGLEGIVSKKIDSRYVQSRSATWVKVKRVEVGAFVIIGFLSNMPNCVSSLVLAEERNGELVYACRAGSGISDDKGRALHAALSKLECDAPVVDVPRDQIPRTPVTHWVEPSYTAEIGYRSRSTTGAPRAPVFMSFAARPQRSVAKAMKPRLVTDRVLAAVQLTNPEREIFAGSGATKLDLAIYYARVGDWLLPDLLRRPVTIYRCPTGALKDCFYQRHAFNGLPPGVQTIELADEKERAAFIAITEPKGFLAMPQFGAIEFHLWGCTIDDPEHPDRLVMDLDPDTALPWSRICDGAEILRERLEAMGFHPLLRTTGGKGLHLVMALAPGHSWPQMKGFAEAFAKAMAGDHPQLFTAISSKERRKGRIYLDYLRNGRGASAVASYSLRARPGFPVATPIFWEELRKLSGGDAFNRLNLTRRLETLVSDPWDELVSSAVKITPKMRRDVGLKT